jgi:hypothetical protein
MNCAILQPSYIPWRGYFDQIRRADLFVFFDDVQFDKHGWRNRNQIITSQGKQWLTIPVHSAGVTGGIPIKAIKIDWSKPWAMKHWKALTFAYAKAPFFKNYKDILEQFYHRHDLFLADFTIDFTITLAREIGICQTRFIRSSEIPGMMGQKTDRLIQILKHVGATHYISGPSAKDYLEEEKFSEADITFEFLTYNYPEYHQLHSPYDPKVSILDLLFMTGSDSLQFITG